MQGNGKRTLPRPRHCPFLEWYDQLFTVFAVLTPFQDDRPNGSKNGQISPQRYENGALKDSPASRYPAISPTKPPYNSYGGPQTGLHGPHSVGGYDAMPTSALVENELSLALRGMAVEDDYSGGRQLTSQVSGIVGGGNPHIRAPPVHPMRTPYGYPQTDYPNYYTNGHNRETYVDYSYAYDAYRGASDSSLYGVSTGMGGTSPANLYPTMTPQTVHANAVADMHRQQPGLFFDYGAAQRHGSQYYYPTHQPMMYAPSHSPMLTPQMATANPASVVDKKQVRTQ